MWFFPGMIQKMEAEVMLLSKRLVACFTNMWFLPVVDQHVLFETRFVCKHLVACFTFVGVFVSVNE